SIDLQTMPGSMTKAVSRSGFFLGGRSPFFWFAAPPLVFVAGLSVAGLERLSWLGVFCSERSLCDDGSCWSGPEASPVGFFASMEPLAANKNRIKIVRRGCTGGLWSRRQMRQGLK